MHFYSTTFRGNFHCTVSDTLRIRTTHSPPTTVCIQTQPVLPLPLWLRVYALSGAWACRNLIWRSGTCVRYAVEPPEHSMLFISSLINFNTWTLELPYCPSIPLEHVIGKRAVHVRLLHGEDELCRVVVQQRRHCARLKH